MLLRFALAATIASAAVATATVRADAQFFAARPITLVVPFPAGGPTDTIGRILAEALQASLGQTVIVENAPGAGGSIGVGKVARADADGHTLILGTIATHVFNGAAYPLKYDVVADFEPISLVAFYRGLGPAMRDLMAGHIDILFDLAANSMPQIETQSIKPLAVTAHSRLSSAPEIPTVDEAGLPGVNFLNWHAIWAPRGTPVEITVGLNTAVRKILADPSVLKRLADIGQQAPSLAQQTPQALATYQGDEIAKWWPVIKAAEIREE